MTDHTKSAQAGQRDALLQVALDFIGTLTGMSPPPIETAPPEVFAPFYAFVDRVQSITAAPQGVPDGWKLVPLEPTREMVAKGHLHTMRADEQDAYRANGAAIAAYHDMLAAAPAAPQAEPQSIPLHRPMKDGHGYVKVRMDTTPDADGWCFCTPMNHPDDVSKDGAYDESAQFFGRVEQAEPQQPEQAEWRHVETVADMVHNLLTLDQSLPIYGAQYIQHEGRRRAIAVDPTISRERVKDGRWIGEGDDLNTIVVWTRAEQPAGPVSNEPSSTGWLPIETAPKNGCTLLLGYWNSHGNWFTLRGQWFSEEVIYATWEDPDLAAEGWYETPVEIDDTPNCFWTEPTHWQPLPSGPDRAARAAPSTGGQS